MKNIMLFVMLLFVSITIQAQVGNDFQTLMADTISNSQYKTQTLNLDLLGVWDSLKVSVVATGEIDLDTLRVQGGVKIGLSKIRGIAKDTTLSSFEALEANVLTINNADGATTIVQGAATITKNEAVGYNQLKFILWAAAAGNTATGQTQNFAVYLQVYRPVQYPN